MKTVLIIPAHNEEKRIGLVIESSKALVDVVIVVDDGSIDETTIAAKKFGGNVLVLRHQVNLGKGAALKTGCQAALRLGAEIIVTIDGDGQHPPQFIPQVIKYLKENNLDFVFTVRQGGDKMPLVRRVGNFTLNAVAYRLFNLKLRDIWCGFRVFRADCLPKVNWRKSDYSGEIQMALKVGRNGLRYGEFIIPTIYNDKFKGLHILHGLKLLAQMIVWRIIL